MKRLTSLLLALVLCMSFAAFTANAEGYEIVYDGTAFAPIVTEPVTITLFSVNGASVLGDYSTMKWFHKALENTNINLVTEIIPDGGMFAEVYNTRMAAGVDLADITAVRGGDQDGTFANAGLFLPLNAYAEKYGFNQAKLLEKYPAAKGSMYHADGTQYFMPYTLLATEHARQLGLNVRVFEEYGIEVPTTTEELVDTLRALKDAGDWNGNGQADEWPLYIRDMGLLKAMASFWGLDLTNTGFSPDEDGIVSCDWISEEYKDFAIYVKGLLDEGLLNADVNTSGWDIINGQWTLDTIGMTLDWVSNFSRFELDLDPDYNVFTDERRVAVMAALEGPFGDVMYNGRPPVGNVFAITRDCKNPEVAYCLMDYMLNQEVIDMLWVGIEGQDYTKDEAGNYVFSETYIANADNYRFLQGYNADFLPGGQSLYGYGLATNHPDNVAQWAVNNEVTVLPISFAFLDESYNEIINTYSADFNTYVSEAFAAFIYGNRDIEAEWDTYVEECMALGLEKLTEVYQARYDASK